jgi:DNA modification methylase
MSGSGTTLRVAQRLGRQYLGIEEQAKFVELIRERLDKPLQLGLF